MADLERARRECRRFIELMEGNRAGCDDAGVAKRILEELASSGQVTEGTRYRLATWCDTGGAPYQRGVPAAREISQALYGRVLRRELERKGRGG
jgi:hypothetical protein